MWSVKVEKKSFRGAWTTWLTWVTVALLSVLPSTNRVPTIACLMNNRKWHHNYCPLDEHSLALTLLTLPQDPCSVKSQTEAMSPPPPHHPFFIHPYQHIGTSPIIPLLVWWLKCTCKKTKNLNLCCTCIYYMYIYKIATIFIFLNLLQVHVFPIPAVKRIQLWQHKCGFLSNKISKVNKTQVKNTMDKHQKTGRKKSFQFQKA